MMFLIIDTGRYIQGQMQILLSRLTSYSDKRDNEATIQPWKTLKLIKGASETGWDDRNWTDISTYSPFIGTSCLAAN